MRLYADVFANARPVLTPPCARTFARDLAKNASEVMDGFETD
jgi:hypothetical protein